MGQIYDGGVGREEYIGAAHRPYKQNADLNFYAYSAH